MENNTKNKKSKRRIGKILASICAVIIVFAIFVYLISACQANTNGGKSSINEFGSGSTTSSFGSGDSYSDYDDEYDNDIMVTEDAEEDRLRTYTASFTMQTSKYDDVNTAINDLTEKYNGYMDSEEQSQKANIDDRESARYRIVTLKIPTEEVSDFIKELQEIDDIYILDDMIYLDDETISYNTTASDLEYYEALASKYERMFTEAETITEIEAVNSYYKNVLNKLDKLKQQKDALQGRVAYSSVSIAVEETSIYNIERESLDFGEQAHTNFLIGWYKFADNMENLILNILSVWVYVLIGLIIFIILIIILWQQHKKAQIREKNLETKQAAIVRTASIDETDALNDADAEEQNNNLK